MNCKIAFEAWAKQKGYFDLMSFFGEGYNSKKTNTAWLGWQAAWEYLHVLDRNENMLTRDRS